MRIYSNRHRVEIPFFILAFDCKTLGIAIQRKVILDVRKVEANLAAFALASEVFCFRVGSSAKSTIAIRFFLLRALLLHGFSPCQQNRIRAFVSDCICFSTE